MRGHHSASRGERDWRPLRWLERLLFAAGAAALIWCAVMLIDGAIAQQRARSALEIAIAVEELTQAAPVEKPEAPSGRPSRPARLEAGAALAAMSIPRVKLSAMVLHGSDVRTLRRGPGHLEHTAVPGAAGNVVIAGHRDSFFRPLRHVRIGDDIFLETSEGRFHYRVTSLRVVGPRDVDVLAPTSEEVLTLITCYPFWVLGHAPDRFIVRATRVADHPSTVIEAWTLPLLDWIQAPTFERVSARNPTSTSIVTAGENERLVREAVTRYLATQGSWSATCGVTVTGDRATAACESAVHSREPEQPGRIFSLERSHQAWAITSIELQ
jgi:sortase A